DIALVYLIFNAFTIVAATLNFSSISIICKFFETLISYASFSIFYQKILVTLKIIVCKLEESV
ncbi:hypothetical protein N4844_15595, partial [Enterococcus faecalis]|uniref:hypothetical protein n=1 Tax=Enterococcus faecalis TaxID=1351 RepID=UPI0021E077D1